METDAREDGSIVSHLSERKQLFELMRHYLLLITHLKVFLYKGLIKGNLCCNNFDFNWKFEIEHKLN